MIILDAPTKSLQVKLAGSVAANQLPFSMSYVDTTGVVMTPGAQDGASNNTTAVTVASAPAASTKRLIKHFIIQNADTAAAKVTVIYNNNSTLRNVVVVTLAVGDQLIYEDEKGWICIDANGNTKTTLSGGGGTGTFKVGNFTYDVSTASGNQNVTGVGFEPKSLFVFASIGSTPAACFGFTDGVGDGAVSSNTASTVGHFASSTNQLLSIRVSSGNAASAVLSSFDSDGFTLTWTKVGSPTGTATLVYFAIG